MYYGVVVPDLLALVSMIVFAGVSYFIWTKGKALAALLMMAGFAVMILSHFLIWFRIWFEPFTYAWLPSIGAASAAFGFGLTFWKKIEGDVRHLREELTRVKDAAADRISSAAHKGVDDDAPKSKPAPAKKDEPAPAAEDKKDEPADE